MPNDIIVEMSSPGEIIVEISGMTYQSVAAQLAALDVEKADQATTYTKTETDTKDGLLVPKTTTVNAKALTGNISIAAADVPNTPAGGIAATTVQAALNELDGEKADKATTYTKTETDTALATKASKLMATNRVTNGDFSQGTTGWSKTGGSIMVVNGELNFLATAEKHQAYTLGAANGSDLYYFKANIKSDSLLTALFVFGISTPIKTINTSENVSVRLIPNGGYSIGIIDGRTEGFTTIYVKNVIAINLTVTFGAGNEPTKEQMDRLLAEFPNSWFDGTQEILPLKALSDIFAMKAQEAWITPTLLNGATGMVKYRKNNFGAVECYGDITVGTGSGGTAIFDVPSGYRATYFPIIRGYVVSTGARVDMRVVGNQLQLAEAVTSGYRLSFYLTFVAL